MLYSVASDGTHVFRAAASAPALLITANLVETAAALPEVYAKLPSTTISCLLGTIRLKQNRYVVLADRHVVTGSILGHAIARLTAFRVVALLLRAGDAEEKRYLELLEGHLRTATLYFSVGGTFDLTRRLQAQLGGGGGAAAAEKAAQGAPLAPAAAAAAAYDPEFCWNGYLLEELEAYPAFVTPVIYGYFKLAQLQAPDHRQFEFALLTRRAVWRAGTRYFRRGADADGHVANFNETEQLLTTAPHDRALGHGTVYLFVQIRGSVPTFWAEINNLKYKPNLVILQRAGGLDATRRHFERALHEYGEVYCVNLVNQRGYEKPIKDAFEQAVAALKGSDGAAFERLHYTYFDFHHECRNMHWERVDLLLKHLIDLGYTSDNYFQYDLATQQTVSLQTKVVRTNCMDCLDRTNVVQLTLARWVLQSQLTRLQLLLENAVTPWLAVVPHLVPIFQNLWADNADAVSCAYLGTGALKTDYTRTGRRTRRGALADFVNSATRYYKNNFADGARQDGYDLVLGRYRPYEAAVVNPFVDRRPPYVQLLPYLMGTSLLVTVAILLFPRGDITGWRNLLAIGLSVLFNVRSLVYMWGNGYQFVNWPKLERVDFLKKVEVTDLDGKSTGVRYEEADEYRVVNKKAT
jgi:hypothetical protein